MTAPPCPCPPCLAARSLDLGYDREPCAYAATLPACPAPLVSTYAGRAGLTDAGIALLRCELATCHDAVVDPVAILRSVAPELDLEDEDLRAAVVVETRAHYRDEAECDLCDWPRGVDCVQCGDTNVRGDFPVPRLRGEDRVVCACCLAVAPDDLAACAECDQALRPMPRARGARVAVTTEAEEAGKVAE